MAIYAIFLAPLEQLLMGQIRADIMWLAEKDVLEIGTGSGINFRYYNFNKISNVTSLDLAYPEKLAQQYPEISFVTWSIEELPFEDNRFDTVVVSLVLCSVDAEKSLLEIKRVLKPGGRLIFLEHVKPTGKLAGRIADGLNPLWAKAANGCNLNRPTGELLKQAGFFELNIREKGVFRYGYGKF